MTALTIDKILHAQRLLDAAPKPCRLFSYSLWPEGSATRIEHPDETRILAHPSFWTEVKARCTPLLSSDPMGIAATYMGLQLIDLDHPAHRQPRAEVITDLVARVMTAMPPWRTPCDTDPENDRPAANTPEADR